MSSLSSRSLWFGLIKWEHVFISKILVVVVGSQFSRVFHFLTNQKNINLSHDHDDLYVFGLFDRMDLSWLLEINFSINIFIHEQ